MHELKRGSESRSEAGARSKELKIVLLFTRFPVATETFLQREVRALQQSGARFECWSLWKGVESFEGIAVRRTPLTGLLKLLWCLPYWLLTHPRRMGWILRGLTRLRWRNPTNYAENLLGIGLGLVHARQFVRSRDSLVLHAVWASLPAAFGWTVHKLTALPFTFAGHAYDLFEDGGDGLLGEKIQAASWFRSSTDMGRRRLIQFGAPESRTQVIRRGLIPMPSCQAVRWPREVVRLLSVGRFVPKMGYSLLAEVFDALQSQSIEFEARIIGEGPGREIFEQRRQAAPWRQRVTLLGQQPYARVEEALAWTDLLLFTGVVAESGDQAGLPNIIGEAMAVGRPVVTTVVGGVGELLDGSPEKLIATRSTEERMEAIRKLRDDAALYSCLAKAGRDWVEREFDAGQNVRQLRAALEAVAREGNHDRGE